MAATVMTKHATRASASHYGERRLPPEAYGYTDDVTAAAVEQIRQKAALFIKNEEWEVVDGFGIAQPA